MTKPIAVIIGSSNEQALASTLQLGESLEYAMSEFEWHNYAAPNSRTPQFVQQAWNSVDPKPTLVVVGLTSQLFETRAFELLKNMHKIAAIHKTSRIFMMRYPEQALRAINPKYFDPDRVARGYELANLRDYNANLDILVDLYPHVRLIDYPEYITTWYTTGREADDGLHADAGTTIAMAQRIALYARQEGLKDGYDPCRTINLFGEEVQIGNCPRAEPPAVNPGISFGG